MADNASVAGGATYDVVVLGGGPVGENVADHAHRRGLSAVVVESELVGGECSYWACMPSKALLRPVELLAAARDLDGVKQAVTGGLDVDAVLARRDAFTSHYDDAGQVSWLDGAGLALVRGHGRITGEREVTVDGVVLRARHAVVVCTGSAAAIPPVDGLADAAPWTSREATSAKAAPGRLAILGGGVVALEMATAWRALGAQEVTVLERGDALLSSYEPEVGPRLTAALSDAGVTVRLGVNVSAVRRRPDGTVALTVSGDELLADEILVATGRTPRTTDIGLEVVGLEPGRSLPTGDDMRVTGGPDWLYAAGDATGRVLLTHQGKYQARVVGAVIAARAHGEDVWPEPWSRHAATADDAAVPQVVFTHPQVASVGLTAQAARDRGRAVRRLEVELGSVAGASLARDGDSGWACLVIDTDADVVIGATFVGPDVAELVHAATVAVVGEVPLGRLWHAVPSFPTVSEVWLKLLDQLDT